jgi:hypothetical protein
VDCEQTLEFARALMKQVWEPFDSSAVGRFYHRDVVGYHRRPNEPQELAYVVSVVRERAKVGGSEDISAIALRITMILRSEEGVWKVVHLHGGPITSPQSAESVIQDLIHP